MAPRGQSQLKTLDDGSSEGGGGQSGRGHVPKLKRPHSDGSEGVMGGQGEEDVSVVEIPSTGTPTLEFGRHDVIREHFQALAALGVPEIGHGGGSGSVRSQAIVISESTPQTLVTSMTTIVSAIEHADKGPVYVPQARHLELSNTNTIGGLSREVVPFSHVGSGAIDGLSTDAGERREKRGPDEAWRKNESRDGTPRPDDEDDESLRMRKKKTWQEELEAKSKLWTDGKTFWGSGRGRLIADVVHDSADYYCAILNGNEGATAPHGLIMPPPDVPRLRIQDPTQRDAVGTGGSRITPRHLRSCI
ncbi:hypothetical protein CBR_g28892 [Chara braunii]|uniref:Uncharacterized protein n=1 Tax=Chara braunii TaxID=69332 RepID=A0A388LA63_CHABU|nr:hypothetical protein CBR_g28892 [Chara braunii]|eukprot:GBG79176.1 hypothetical protein CBR_g28892 [Chara braunii]